MALYVSGQSFTCTRQGNFPKYGNPAEQCKNFYRCNFDPVTNQFQESSAKCEKDDFVFDPRIGSCVDKKTYQCPEYICKTDDDMDFKFMDINNISGSTYIICEKQGAVIYPSVRNCPAPQKFKTYHHTMLMGRCKP